MLDFKVFKILRDALQRNEDPQGMVDLLARLKVNEWLQMEMEDHRLPLRVIQKHES